MATLSESVIVSVAPTLCGVESGKEDDTVVISNKQSFVHILKLSDQKLISSLPVRVGVNISSPAVWSENRKEYLFVQNKRDICFWREGQTVDKIRKHNFPTDIHKLFSVTSYEPVILCKNGAIGFLSAKDSKMEREIPESESICWCWETPLKEGLGVVYTTSANESRKNMTVHFCLYNGKNDVWSHFASCLDSHGKLLSCAACIGPGQDEVHMFTLWQDGALRQLLMHNSSAKPQGQPIFLKGVTPGCSLLCLSDSYVAVVGLTKNGKDGVGIIDTKFGTVQTWQPLPDDHVQGRQAFCQQNHILVQSGKDLYLFRYECHQLALATMIGQHLGTREEDDQKPIALNVPFRKRTACVSELNSPEKKAKAKEPMQVEVVDSSKDAEEILHILKNLADPTKTSSYSSFQREFALLKKKLPRAEVWAFFNNLFLVLKRCCSEKKFWPAEELAFLVSHQCVTFSNLEMVFEAFLQMKEVSLMYKCLVLQRDDLPDSCLAMALACFLSATEEALVEAMEKSGLSSKGNDVIDTMEMEVNQVTEQDGNTCPFSIAKKMFVDEVLNCSSFDDVFLLDGLKKLPFTHALELMRYILHKMRQIRSYNADPKTNAELMLLLSRWKGILIDANATHLVMAKDAHELLVSFSQEEDCFVSFMSEAHKEIMEQIMLLEARKAIKHQKNVGSYCIEVLHLF